MKSRKYLFFNIFALVGTTFLLISSCELVKSVEEQVTPTLSTLEITEIGISTAITGGNITAEQGTIITARGVCWSTDQNPTVDDSKTEDGKGAGSFTSEIYGLTPGTAYYARAYATYDGGTVYGDIHSFTTNPFGTAIVDVTNPITGRTWMDRNLGASKAASSSTDAEAFGDLFQWGRGSDGHEKRDSPVTNMLSSTNNPGHDKFIGSQDPYDWRSPQNPDLWQGVNGVNNPCPPGYRLPTEAEFIAEMASWISQDAEGAFASPLKFTLAGVRNPDGSLVGVGRDGQYWTYTVLNGMGSQSVWFISDLASRSNAVRGFGFSVRCIKH